MFSFLIKLFATGFYAGYSPRLQGTVGSIVALVLAFLIFPVTPIYQIVFLLISITFAFFVIDRAQKMFPDKDDKRIVIDEIVGYWISIAFLPKTVLILIIAFVLFRIFDGNKIMIKKLESLPHVWGILCDDIAAGIITNLILQIFLLTKII